MSIYGFCEWLGTTPASVALHESRYLYLAILALHVITLFVFVGSIIAQSLRLIGAAFTDVPAQDVLAAMRPWSIGGFVVMAVTGSLLFYAAPLDKFLNVFFRLKLILIMLAGLNVVGFHRFAYDGTARRDLVSPSPAGARLAGVLSLLLWGAVITAGRMIPYQDYWF